MELYYCTICGLRVSDTEIHDGNAVISSERRVLCKKCFTDVKGAKPAAAKPASSRMAAQPTSAAAAMSPAPRAHVPHSASPARAAKPAQSPAMMWVGVAAAVGVLAFVATQGGREPAVHDAPRETPAKAQPAPAETKTAVVVETPTAPKFTSSFKAVPIHAKGNSRGYWEFLPSAYYANPTQSFPIVIFFSNVPESGDGSAVQLEKMKSAGPPKILSESAHPLHNLFEERGVIVISVQGPPAPDWWHGVHITPVLSEVLRAYRIDSKRIYLTGIVAGSLGLHELMDQFADQAKQSAAIWMMCSQGGAGVLGEPKTGPEVASKVPYWAFVNAASSSETVQGIDKIAAKIAGKPVSTVSTNAPAGGTQTALFSPTSGWTWKSGIATPGNANPILTLTSTSPEETWAMACNSVECWNWLFAQKK